MQYHNKEGITSVCTRIRACLICQVAVGQKLASGLPIPYVFPKILYNFCMLEYSLAQVCCVVT